MKRAALLVSALAVVLYTVSMSAQASFSGKWTMDPASAPAGGGGGRGGGGGGAAVSGPEVTITQDATSLTVAKTQGQNPVTLKYTLDGKDSKNTVQGRGGAVEMTSQAMMAGGKITITTTADMGRGPTTTKQVLSMDGGMLKVETTAPGRGGGAPMTTTTTYKKG
jgi:hypothetical protein